MIRVVTLTINYHFGVQVDHGVEAYSLIARQNDWFLVGRVAGNFRVFDFSQIDKVDLLDTQFERDLDFDLANFWRGWQTQYSGESWNYPVEMWVSPLLLQMFSGRRTYKVLQETWQEGDRSSWKLVEINFKSFDDALFSVLNYGAAALVVKPKPLQLSVQDYAEQILDVYRETLTPDE